MATETLSVSEDFSNGVAPDRFKEEIVASPYIFIALNYIQIDEDDCNCVFKASLSQDEKNALVAIAATHSGLPLPSTVVPVLLEPTGDPAKRLQVVSVEFEANLEQETTKEVQFSETREIQGISTEVINHQPGPSGDTVRIAVHVPDGQGGWIEAVVLARGEVASNGCVVPPSGTVNVVSEGTATIPSSVKIVVKYNCVKTTGDKPLVTMLFRTWV